MTGKPVKNNWKNRIVGEGERAAKDFILNPLNFRTHPDLQREAIVAILGEVGWVQRVLVNKTTGNTLDGHLRVEEALKKGENTLVPYVEIEVSEAEERKILALFDKISAMAGKDIGKYEELSDMVEFDSPILEQLLNEMRDEDFNIDEFFEQSLPEDEQEFSIEIVFKEESEYRDMLDALKKIDKSPKKAIQKLLSI